MTKMHRRTFLAAAGMTALAHGRHGFRSLEVLLCTSSTHRQWGMDVCGRIWMGSLARTEQHSEARMGR